MYVGEMATTHQMAIRIMYLFVLFKGKLNLPKSSPVPCYELLGWTYKVFVVTLLGVFTLNMALTFKRGLLGGAKLENKEKTQKWLRSPMASFPYLLWERFWVGLRTGQCCSGGPQTPPSRRLSSCSFLPALFKGTPGPGCSLAPSAAAVCAASLAFPVAHKGTAVEKYAFNKGTKEKRCRFEAKHGENGRS